MTSEHSLKQVPDKILKLGQNQLEIYIVSLIKKPGSTLLHSQNIRSVNLKEQTSVTYLSFWLKTIIVNGLLTLKEQILKTSLFQILLRG